MTDDMNRAAAWIRRQKPYVQTVAIVAGGPSLTHGQLQDLWLCRSRPSLMTIVINSSWRNAPWAHVLYAADAEWWKQPGAAPQNREFLGVLTSVCDSLTRSDVMRFELVRDAPGLVWDIGRLGSGENSGFQALNLAAQLEPARILLLGYDMKLGPMGEVHHHGPHVGLRNPSRSSFPRWIRFYEHAAEQLAEKKIECWNCSTDSALTCFPSHTVKEGLGRY